jgi:hypothetical protein
LFCSNGFGMQYALSVVAKVGNTIDGKTLTSVDSATINSAGEITFRGGFSGGKGLFGPDGLIVETGDVIDGRSINDIGAFAVNDVGDLTFFASFGGVEGLFTKNALLAEPGTNIGGLTITGFGPAFSIITAPTINNFGTVAFAADIAGGRAVFTQDALVAAPFTVIDGFVLTGVPFAGRTDISDSGRVLFQAHFQGETGVFTQNRRIYASGMTFGGLTATGANWVAMTEDDVVGINVIHSSGPRTIVVDDIQLISESSSIDGFTVGNFSSESLNDFGTVTFAANIPGFGSGIFTPTDKVAASGSIVGGGILASNFAGPVINNAGDIVFRASFLDGTSAIILAKAVGPGDYNRDGIVDAADYVVWRRTLGQSGQDLAADGNSNNRVDTADFEVWRAHFGQDLAEMENGEATVPEPSALTLVAIAGCALLCRSLDCRRRATP